MHTHTRTHPHTPAHTRTHTRTHTHTYVHNGDGHLFSRQQKAYSGVYTSAGKPVRNVEAYAATGAPVSLFLQTLHCMLKRKEG